MLRFREFKPISKPNPPHSPFLKKLLGTGVSIDRLWRRVRDAPRYGKANFVNGDYSLLNGVTCVEMDATTKRIAMQRIQTLFSQAKEIFREDPSLAQRYVWIARKIAMAAKVRLPREYRRQVCRHCKSFILPGVNCRVRIKQRREPHVVITCLNCGKQMRTPLRKKRERQKA